ncbi:hypothetical protein SAMN05192588_1275 [Nonlabens sp. Hel1_33_55]|uniref:hypothetical protein n=1 Tax=Nonlabens sp. Hel1_33_55 TaxID=1336802 RepID=UPI000875E6AA|nr:hypothetical protein [Nonlabens sp. Hel1_33_55]SCY12632.1 hypothetical protein SAMN05192588_1275 [Nonlabens sp. Hel1_33_55]
MADSKSNYNLLLAIAFIGIGSWKTYDYYTGDETMATYQVVLSILLIVIGFYQLWRWNVQREKP